MLTCSVGLCELVFWWTRWELWTIDCFDIEFSLSSVTFPSTPKLVFLLVTAYRVISDDRQSLSVPSGTVFLEVTGDMVSITAFGKLGMFILEVEWNGAHFRVYHFIMHSLYKVHRVSETTNWFLMTIYISDLHCLTYLILVYIVPKNYKLHIQDYWVFTLHRRVIYCSCCNGLYPLNILGPLDHWRWSWYIPVRRR
jgi:hypothetical protein